MAAPTQEYPPWLSPSAVVITNDAGEVFTSTTVVYLPLTYVGPSIPLNDQWSYGGSTYPPSILVPSSPATSSPTAVPPAPTTTSTTTSATPPPTTDPTTDPGTTSPSTSTSPTGTDPDDTPTSSPTTETTSTTPTEPTSTPTTLPPTITSSPSPTTSSPTETLPTTSIDPTDGPGPAVGALSRGQLVGVIVASILGLIFLFVFLLALWLWCKGRRNRRSAQFTTITPLDDDYFIVGEDGRTPGEGSPRHSGEEADPFLQRSGTSGMVETATEMGTRPGVSRVPPPATGSMSSSGSSSNASGYGVLLERPTLGILPSMAEEGENPFTGYRFSEDEMRELNRESVLPQEESEQARYSGAYAINKDPTFTPPRLVDPDNAFAHPDIPRPQLPYLSNPRFSAQSAVSATDAEDAALLTARRVNVGDLPPAGSREPSPSTNRTGILDAIGLSGLTNIGRLFNSGDSQRNSGRYSPTFSPEPKRHSRRTPPGFSPLPLSEPDPEGGRALPRREPPEIDSFGRVRALTVGTGFDGQRPVSNISGRSGTSVSGATIWHDARTSPSTPAFQAHSVPSRAHTPAVAEPAFPEHAWLAGAVPPAMHSPPAYSDDPFVDTDPVLDVRPPPPASTTATGPTLDDILDQPAPGALTHFTSSSSMRDSGTVSSIGLSKNPFPPGLDYEPKKHIWTPEGSLSAASATSSPLWHQITHTQGYDVDAHGSSGVVDILEEEPPNAQGTWRSMASGGAVSGLGELGRRTTFGLPQINHPRYIASEQGSLHSMRSHVNPPSVRSTGSAPASHSGRSANSSMHSGSLSSTSSSRPSAHSATSSLAHSLVRSGSIITDGRRRFDPRIQIPTGTPPPGLPPLSAFGNRGFITPPRSAVASSLSVERGGALTGEAMFNEMASVDGSSQRTSVHFSPGAPTIRTVNSGSTCTAVPQGARTRTISAVTFGSVIPGGTMGVPMENGEEGDLGLLNDVNASGRLGSAWMPASVV